MDIYATHLFHTPDLSLSLSVSLSLSEHNTFSIRQPLIRLKEIEQQTFGKPNCRAKLVIVDYSKSIIKVVPHEIFG